MSYFEGFNGPGKMLNANPPMNVIQQFTYDQNGLLACSFRRAFLCSSRSAQSSDPTQLTGLYEAYDPHMKLNKSLQFNAGIQREIVPNLLLDVAYVRTLTEDMTNALIGNQAIPWAGPAEPPPAALFRTHPSSGRGHRLPHQLGNG